MSALPSSRVVKAAEARNLTGHVAFNFEDIQSRCDDYLTQVRSQAAKILEEAEAASEAARRRAEEEGREAGRKAGLAEAAAKVDAQARTLADTEVKRRLSTLAPALEAAARMVSAERERWLAEWETAALRLSVEIAGHILRSQLRAHPEQARTMILDALQLAAGSTRLKLRLHPADLALLGDNAADLVKSVASCGDAMLLPDESIERGGCIVETHQGTIDARLSTQLERIAEELMQQSL